MAESAVQLRDIPWTPTRVAFVVLLFASGSLDFVIAAATERHVFSVLALAILVGFVVYVTEEWRSVFYLLAVVYAGLATVLWLYLGSPLPTVGLFDTAVQGLFALVSLGLYVSNRLD